MLLYQIDNTNQTSRLKNTISYSIPQTGPGDRYTPPEPSYKLASSLLFTVIGIKLLVEVIVLLTNLDNLKLSIQV